MTFYQLCLILLMTICSLVPSCHYSNMLSLSQFSKLSLDHNILKNYHPVSNYSFLSKVTKKIVTQQLGILISADCLCHSTEISLLKMTNSILCALHGGDMLKTCLDPYWSVFCLRYYWPPYSFSQTSISLQHLWHHSLWFESYRTGRTRDCDFCLSSRHVAVSHGVP